MANDRANRMCRNYYCVRPEQVEYVDNDTKIEVRRCKHLLSIIRLTHNVFYLRDDWRGLYWFFSMLIRSTDTVCSLWISSLNAFRIEEQQFLEKEQIQLNLSHFQKKLWAKFQKTPWQNPFIHFQPQSKSYQPSGSSASLF